MNLTFRRLSTTLALWLCTASLACAAHRFVDDSLQITNDTGTAGLSNGDTVTFSSGQPNETPGLIFGTNAFSTIGNAVAAASSGDFIYVAAGNYPLGSSITVDKALTILGAQAGVDPRPSTLSTRISGSASESTLSGPAPFGKAFQITSSHVVIDGFTIGNTSTLIESTGALRESITVRHCFLHTASTGIRFTAVNSAQVEDNAITGISAMGIEFATDSFGSPMYSQIVRNEFYNLGGASYSVGISVDRGMSTDLELFMNVAGNLFRDMSGDKAISLASFPTPGASFGSVSDNVFSGLWAKAITVSGAFATISRNEIKNCETSPAIRVTNARDGFEVTENDFRDNGSISPLIEVNYSGPLNSGASLLVNRNRFLDNGTHQIEFISSSGYLDASLNYFGEDEQALSSAVSPTSTGAVDLTPSLIIWEDQEPSDPGFQLDGSKLYVRPFAQNLATSGVGEIQEALDLLFHYIGTLRLSEGAYQDSSVQISPYITLEVAGEVSTPISYTFSPSLSQTGKITGSGTLNGTFSFSGTTIAPGTDADRTKVLSFDGSSPITLGSDVTFEADIDGPAIESDQDRISSNTALNLGDATLDLRLHYTPSIGDVLVVARTLGGSLTGTFAELPHLHQFKVNDTTFEVRYTATQASLTAVIPNLTLADYDQPKELFAATGIAPGSGTFTGPGVIGSTFDPGSVGPGHHTITYTPSGNSTPYTFRITLQTSNVVVTHTTDDDSEGSLRWALSVVEDGGYVEFSNGDNGPTDFYDGTPRTITFNGTQIVLARDVHINGPGTARLTFDAGGLSRFFEIKDGAWVTIRELTFLHGRSTLQPGGAIYASNSTLDLSDCIFRENSAPGYEGGAIYSDGANLDVSGCKFLDNSVSAASSTVSGGAIAVRDASIYATGCLFLRNTADGLTMSSAGQGGAVFAMDQIATFRECTFIENSATDGIGGAVFLGNNQATFRQCTLANNSAISNQTFWLGIGGAIHSGGTVEVIYSTIVRNEATLAGGLHLTGSSTIEGSIIAENSQISGSPGPDIFGTFTSLGYNLIGATDDSNGSTALDLVGTSANRLDPKLATELTERDGYPIAFLPLLGSPVINAGNPAFDPDDYWPELTRDQLQRKRVAGSRIDIGAVESGTYTPQITATSTIEDTQTTTGLVITPNPMDNGETTHFAIGNLLNGTLYLADGVTALSFDPNLPIAYITVAQGAAGLKFTPAANRNSDTDPNDDIGFAAVATKGTNFPADLLGELGDDSLVAQVVIPVTPVNDPPTITVDDPDPIPMDSGLQTINLSDISGGPLESSYATVDISTDKPALLTNLTLHHTINQSTGTITYLPAAGASGTATITITLDDGESTNSETIRTLTVVIQDPTPPPVAYTNGKTAITINVLANAGLPSGGTLTILTQGLHGKATVVNGQVKYTPSKTLPRGGDSFTYRYDDGHGNITTETVTITNFATLAGTYDGLINSPYTGPGLERHIRNGYLRLTVGQGGTFSGSITFAGEQLGYVERAGFRGYVFNGKLGAGATDLRVIARPPQGNVTLTLEFDPVANLITGTAVSLDNNGHGFTSQVELHPQAPAGQAAGNYTMLIQPDNTPNSPPGAGYATTVIDAKGAVRVVGKLPDGSTFTTSAGFRADQSFPIYSALYSGKFAQRGSIRGMISFPSTPLPVGDASGTLEWFKPVRSTDVYHPNGFDLTRTALLGRYTKPVGTAPVLAFAPGQLNGHLLLEGGGLAAVDQALTLLTGTRFILAVPNPSKAMLTVDAATGLFRGTFDAPNKKRYPFNGALLQGAKLGAGYFVNPDTKQTGAVEIVED